MKKIGRDYHLTVLSKTMYATYECPRCAGIYAISVSKAEKMEVCEKCRRKERDHANLLAGKQSNVSKPSGQ